LEANYGNGLLKDTEHRKQFKWNALRVFDFGRHEITLLSIGYFGVSHEGNLVPIGYGKQLGDTVDPRQKDQTHTGLLAINDRWKVSPEDKLSFSGFFRTYNLTLFSNFGEGLIRQSEFRTVEGGEARETHVFTPWLEGMAGLDYNEDDIHRDNLDHFPLADAKVYGSFVKVLSNSVNLRDVAPFVALHGDLGIHLRFYAGLRPDAIEMKNTDMVKPAYSFDEWKVIENPKATLAWTPGAGPVHWLPSASFSIGQAFFTQDPRISVIPSSAAGWRSAMAGSTARGSLGRRAKGRQVCAAVYAGQLRQPGSRDERGLPLSERLVTGEVGLRQNPRTGLDLRRRLCWRRNFDTWL
jgi:hypothetical protein